MNDLTEEILYTLHALGYLTYREFEKATQDSSLKEQIKDSIETYLKEPDLYE